MMHENNGDFETFTLTLDEGVTQDFAILKKFKFNGQDYMLVASVTSSGISDEDLDIFTFEPENGGETLIVNAIENEAEFEAVVEHLRSLDDMKND